MNNRMAARLYRLAHCCACSCGNSAVVVGGWYGEPAPPEEVTPCPQCGGPLVIQIVEDENWYGNRAHELTGQEKGKGQ
jgi:hypothetical protein